MEGPKLDLTKLDDLDVLDLHMRHKLAMIYTCIMHLCYKRRVRKRKPTRFEV